MRHGKKFMHLGRKSAHRKSMLANMSCSLVEHKRIKTTLTKAKALKKFFEPLLTKSKKSFYYNMVKRDAQKPRPSTLKEMQAKALAHGMQMD